MVVSYSLGEKSKKIINTLKKTADNVEFHSSNSIQELVKEAKLRHLDFKRIIFSSAILKNPEKDLNELNDFIKNYSNSTEIVMVIMSLDKGVDKIFNSIFNSPMYTCVILPKASPRNLLELVLSNIMELKTKYYSLEVGEKGNSKNSEESSEIESEDSSEGQDISNVGNLSSNTDSKNYMENLSESIIKSTEARAEEESYDVKSEENYDFSENTSGSDDTSDIEVSNYGEFSDDDLSIGDFGSQHSDTGFLDDEEDEELREYLEKSEKSEKLEDKEIKTEKEKPNLEKRKVSTNLKDLNLEERKVELVKENIERSHQDLSKLDLPNIDMVVYSRGSGATQAIIEEALKIVKSDNAEVLIIDLDTRENGVLSFIDLDSFYNKSYYEGINKQRIYKEDGVSIVSNGYGLGVSTNALKTFLSSLSIKKFDMIFIDCPIDCLSIIDRELVTLFNVLIYSLCERNSLYSTSIQLTNRDYLSLDVERYIMNSCMVEIVGDYSKDDVEFIRASCLFANGNWLDRIGL